MSTIITGVAADPTTGPRATVPVDGDAGNAASVGGAFQLAMNFIAWLRTNGAMKGETNTFTGTQNFVAAVSFLAALAHDLDLGSHKLAGLANGTLATDGVNKGQLDGAVASITDGPAVTWCAGWAQLGGNSTFLKKQPNGLVTLNLTGIYSSGGTRNVAIVPAGYRPSAFIYMAGVRGYTDTATAVPFTLDYSGMINMANASDFAAGRYQLSVTYPAAS